jgi:ketosteroid isomerase-like protein
MSQEDATAPDPIWISFEGARPPSRRTLDEAIWVRLPALARKVRSLTLRLPRRSRLRQAILRRAVLLAQGGWVRGDFEFGLSGYAPDAALTAEFRTGARLDFEPSYRGREGVRAFVRTYQEAFGAQSYQPRWLVDLGGNVFATVLHHRLRGRASGVEVEQLSAHRIEIRNGQIVREEVHAAAGHDWEPIARAVGPDPAALASRLSG